MCCNITRAGNHSGLTLYAAIDMFQHVFEEIDGTVTGRLGSYQTAAKLKPFAGKHPSEAIGDSLILTKHKANFPGTYANITSGDVGIFANMTIQFRHKRLTEAHDFVL